METTITITSIYAISYTNLSSIWDLMSLRTIYIELQSCRTKNLKLRYNNKNNKKDCVEVGCNAQWKRKIVASKSATRGELVSDGQGKAEI